ncbi:MAG TPA: ferritin-like domain-containing protein [Polyangiales bacterium]
MTEQFAIEWMGGAAEHFFRRARPVDLDIPWESLDPDQYREPALAAARRVWTEVALSEYAAIASFSLVVSTLVEARAPLDLIGMTSDFLADEVKHVELASRLLMRLGGAAPRGFDPTRLVSRPSPSLSPLARANELALRVGCIGEAYASGTAVPMMRATGHPVVRAVYETILRDEARHVRFGSLYFQWADPLLDAAERARLAQVAMQTLNHYASLWRRAAPAPDDPNVASEAEARELGWFQHAEYRPLALRTVREEIVPALRALGLPLPEAELEALLSG